MSPRRRLLNLWVTPKIFADVRSPKSDVLRFFDHHAAWIDEVDEVVLNIATGNGDHVLNYRGDDHLDDQFDWARYNSYPGGSDAARSHNRRWLERVREGGERSDNPYMAGPAVILSEATMDYQILRGIYASFREEARSRGIALILLEYLEPGPEFCQSMWKTAQHPEAARGSADAGGTEAVGLIDVCAVLKADDRAYAAYPDGIPADTIAGDFVAHQAAAFVHGMGTDGILLGNQFGLLGLWNPHAAPPATPERRTGITRFFTRLRDAIGDKRVFWQDSFWPADVEEQAWAMDPSNYHLLDGIVCSNFGVLVERLNIERNIRSKLAIALTSPKPLDVVFSLDFVDPWYWYRTYLDDRIMYRYQRTAFERVGSECSGVMFFANDTFGEFIPELPLEETRSLVQRIWKAKNGADA